MEMEYVEYETELKRLYKLNCKYGNGDCLEICGEWALRLICQDWESRLQQ